MNAIKAKLEQTSTELLIEMAETLVNDFQEGADIVFNETINALEARLPENEFIALCDRL